MKQLTTKEIVLFALYSLGGWEKRIHTEDVALKCFELAPNKFSWIKFPKYPDPAPARFALEAAKKADEGRLVKGESEKKKSISNIGGWMLTPRGVSWVKKNRKKIEHVLSLETSPSGDRLQSDRKIKELTSSTAFQKFLKFGNDAKISLPEFAESLICTVNTSRNILLDKIEQLRSIAENLNRNDVVKYTEFIQKRIDNQAKENYE